MSAELSLQVEEEWVGWEGKQHRVLPVPGDLTTCGLGNAAVLRAQRLTRRKMGFLLLHNLLPSHKLRPTELPLIQIKNK